MQPFSIAGLQLALPGRADNLPRMRERLNHLMTVFPWVQMVVFSELSVHGPWIGNATPLPGPVDDAFAEMARKHGVWLINGSHFEALEGKVFNTSTVFDPEGSIVGRYRKMFPFRPYEAGVTEGTEFMVFDVPDVGRFGMSICYDMWFPETSRQLAAMGVEVILHPAMTTTIDRDVELAIARATAAMNQCFVVDINGAGDVGNGRSVFVGPAGDVLYEADRAEQLIPLEVDLARVRRSREIGLRGLGQPLKSFRDTTNRFPVYGPEGPATPFLNTLGALSVPARGTVAGLRQAAEAVHATHAPAELAPAPVALPPVTMPPAPAVISHEDPL